MLYRITVKPRTDKSFAPDGWMSALKDIDAGAAIQPMDDDANGNKVYEVLARKNLAPLRKIRRVVSVE